MPDEHGRFLNYSDAGAGVGAGLVWNACCPERSNG
jgi:hypothetical protein